MPSLLGGQMRNQKYCGVCDTEMEWDGEDWCCPNPFCDYHKEPNNYNENFERYLFDDGEFQNHM